MKFKRVFLIILDSLGVGEAIDAVNYNDTGCNTLKHINEKHELYIPNLKKLGFLDTINMNENKDVDAYYTIARPINAGKETLTGHYEIVGIKNDVPFKTFTTFPRELIEEIEAKTGRRVIGNKCASGVEIIQELGERQMQYGSLIIYTSSDSVLQVAAHEEVIPVEKLYQYCEIIRDITKKEEWKVGRVIARPFIGKEAGKFKRTINRKDFALKPNKPSILDSLKENNNSVIAIGKISDIFDGQGITKKIAASSNIESVDKILEIMDKNFTGLCFANLNEFDSSYGHRRNPEGYGTAIEEFDVEVPLILDKLNNDDLLILTADHGNDPTYQGSDHTRENVPVIVYSRIFREPGRLPILETFADIGATIADNFKLPSTEIGESFLELLK